MHRLHQPAIHLPFAGLVGAAALLAGAVAGLGSEHATLLLVATLAAATLAVLLVWPELALPLALFVLWANVAGVAVGRGAPQAVGLAIPLILVVPLLARFLRGERLAIDRTFVALLVLLVIQIASTTASSYTATGVEHVLSLATEGVLVYLLVFNAARTPEALRLAAWGLVAAAAFLALVTVVQNVTQTFDKPYLGFSLLDGDYFTGRSDVARAKGPIGDPNYYAQILVASVALAVARLRGERGIWRLALIAAIALMTLGVAFTYSRGAVLALAIVAVAMVVVGYMKLRHLAVMGLAVAALVMVVPGYGDRIASLTKIAGATAEAGVDSGADQSTKSRATENLAAVLVLGDHPALGVGPGAFPYYYQEYAVRTGGTVHRSSKRGYAGSEPGEAPQREAHNLFLGLAGDIGLPGLLALCAVLGFTLGGLLRARRHLRRRPDDDVLHTTTGMLLALVAYLSAGLFLSLAYERYLWALVALAGAAASVALRSERARG